MTPSDHKPKIIVLVGTPGSGKTTWTKKFLAENHDYVVVSSDDILERYAAADGIHYNQAFSQYIDSANREFNEELRAAILLKQNIIVDRTNMSVKARARVLGNVPKTYEKIAVVFQVDRTELDRRLLQREYDTGKKIPKDALDAMATAYVPPTEAEGFAEIIFA